MDAPDTPFHLLTAGTLLARGVTAKLVALSPEYLFFIGTTYLSILLLTAHRHVASAIAFSLGVLWLSFHLPLSLYLELLGADSFAETGRFDFHEAAFWFQTLGAVHPAFSAKKFLAYFAFSLISFHLLKHLLQRLSPWTHSVTKLSLSVALIAVAVQMTISSALASYFNNSDLFVAAAANFGSEVPEVTSGPGKTSLVVYIGESTSVMDMGLYGYPRRTTPLLSEFARKDENLIVFRNVFSTHTHTSGSLLEALSLGSDTKDEEFLPIYKRKRIPVVDVFRKANFDTRLFSNQIDGPWNHVSSVIFRNSRNLFRQTQTDLASSASSVWDDEFFESQLDALGLEHPARRQAIFLHSYAGHGRYYANIPERFRQPVDQALSQLDRNRILEDPAGSVEMVEEYDAAIRYVDYSVAKIIVRVQQRAEPIILVYFSDHGDAAYSGRGHDSARFKHEMVRVPLLIYFNDAATRASPGLFKKYKRLAAQELTSTLAQLSPTLMDLMGIGIRDPARSAVTMVPVMGESTRLPPIVLRETAEGTTYLNINDFALNPPARPQRKFIDRTDADTRAYVAIRSNRNTQSEVCKTGANSFEALSRSILVANCSATPDLARGYHFGAGTQE